MTVAATPPSSMTLDQVLQQAVSHHQAGRLQDAERLYRAILQAQPTHPDANHNLGVIAIGVGKPEAALPFLRAALEANPQQGQYWLSYADGLIRCGQIETARLIVSTARQRGLDGEPVRQIELRLAESPHNAASPTVTRSSDTTSLDSPLEPAVVYREAGSYREATAWLNNWLAAHTEDAEAYAMLAHVLILDKQEEMASTVLDRALAIAADLPAVQRNHARLLLRQNLPEAALLAAQLAHQREPNNPENWLVLAAALATSNRVNEALPLIEHALQARPGYAEAFAARALIRLRANDFVNSLADAEKALAIKPHMSHLWSLVANLRYQRRDLTGAIEALQKALEYEPNNIGYMVDLGELLRQNKQINDAIILLQGAVAKAPDNAAAWTNLGVALQEAGRIDETRAAYARSLEINPQSAEIASNLGALANDDENWELAERMFRHASAIKPDSAEIQCNLGAAIYKLGALAEAKVQFVKALAIDPGYAKAWVSLGDLCVDQGDFAAAKENYSKALDKEPDNPDVWACLTKFRKMTPDDFSWLEKAEHLVRTNLSRRQEVLLRYAMGKFCDDLKDYEQAYFHYRRANELKRNLTKAYDKEKKTTWVNILTKNYPFESARQSYPGASDSLRPLFIVGMPRSGTSLVEQILASHPACFGAGELQFWGQYANVHKMEVRSATYTSSLLSEIASACQQKLDSFSIDARRVIDKMPRNYNFLGLIHAVFPNARILHTLRNPVDTCLSIYFQNFASGHEYANDLEDLAHYYREYHRLMAHWRSVLPPEVLIDVPYEALIDDQEGWSRKMIDFIGLEWDDRCMEFHKTERKVGTASNWQVRQPVYKTSKERWRNYEQFVGPLLPLLELYNCP